MIKYVEHSDIDKLKWDKSLDQCENANVFFASWYLDAVCDRWDALIENDYKTLMPLPITRKMGVEMVFQPFFSRQLGLCGKNLRMTDFLPYIPDSIKHFSIAHGNDITVAQGEQESATFQMIRLDNMDRISSGYNSNAKRNIKKALKNEISVHLDVEPEEVIGLFKNVRKEGLRRFSAKDYDHLNRLMANAVMNNSGVAIGAKKDGKIIAACFFLKFQRVVTYLKGAANETGKSNGAMHLIFHQAMDTFVPNYDVLDFGGSNVNSVARFYKNFGAVDCSYGILKIDKLPLVLSMLKKLKNKF